MKQFRPNGEDEPQELPERPAPGAQLGPEMDDDERHEVAEGFDREISGEDGDPEEFDERKAEEEKLARLDGLGQRIQAEAQARYIQRRPVEERWLQDLRQYHGMYDDDLLNDIKEAGGSQAFVNITGPKTDGFSARMADMILPTDEKNWDIKPSPDPDVMKLQGNEEQATADGQPMADPKTGEPVTVADVATGLERELAERCRGMARVIDDQLQWAKATMKQRDAIDMGAKLGTIVIKGPVVLGRSRKVWKKQVDAEGNTYHEVEIVEDLAPSVEIVDVWNFFPPLTTPEPDAWSDVIERHPMTEKQFADLALQPGFVKERISEILRQGQSHLSTLHHLEEMRLITGEHSTTAQMKFFEVWEYTGPVPVAELIACGCKVSEELAKQAEDPLVRLDAKVWVCDGKVIRAVLKPAEGITGHGYHVTWVKKDETSPFGFGIPRMMRHSQRVANAAWRMILDNAGLATMPQIIMAMGVRPADGNWKLYPGKVWIAKEGVVDVRYAMQVFDIPVRLKELMLIFETAVKLADEETAMPIIMQGDRTPAVPETAEGMAMLFNAASVVQRRFVRFYDDRITKPLITGFYDWNMEFNDREDIKGDWQVVPLGSSALLERERQSQATLQALQLANSPIIEPRVDVHGLIEDAFKLMRLPNRVKDRAEAEKEVARRQQQAAQIAQQEGGGSRGPTPDELQLRQQELAERAETRKANQQMHRERLAVEVEKLHQKTGLDRDKIMAQLGIARLKEDNANQRFNVETQLRQSTGAGI